MRGTPLSEHEKMSIMLLLSSFVRTVAAMAFDIETGEQATGQDIAETMPVYGAMLRMLADPARFPAVHDVIDSGFFDEPQPDEGGFPDDEFAFGLERILDGVEALIRRRR